MVWVLALFAITALGVLPLFFYRLDLSKLSFSSSIPVVAGIGHRDRTTMFVSRGIGTIYVPVRVNCPPEVAVLTLEPYVSAL